MKNKAVLDKLETKQNVCFQNIIIVFSKNIFPLEILGLKTKIFVIL